MNFISEKRKIQLAAAGTDKPAYRFTSLLCKRPRFTVMYHRIKLNDCDRPYINPLFVLLHAFYVLINAQKMAVKELAETILQPKSTF